MNASPPPLTAKTRLLGVIGDPVAQSLSPEIHNPVLRALGLDYRYLAFHVVPSELEAAVKGMAALGVVGFNATVPHKEALIPLMDRLSPQAEAIGAINTVSIGDDGALTGDNTDAYGFATAIEEAFTGNPATAPVVALGAGGAARAVLTGLVQCGFRTIHIANRTLEKAERLAEEWGKANPDATFTALPLEAEKLPLEEAGLLVNTSSLGLKGGGELPVFLDLARLGPDALVADIASFAKPTPLALAAKARGLTVQDGLPMLIHQAARAFNIWTGATMPVALVKRNLLGES